MDFETEPLSIDENFVFHHRIWACQFHCVNANKKSITDACIRELQHAEFASPDKSKHLVKFLHHIYCIQAQVPLHTFRSNGVTIVYKKTFRLFLSLGGYSTRIQDLKFCYLRVLELLRTEQNTFNIVFLIYYLKFLDRVL